MAVTDEAHSSVARAFAILGVDALMVPAQDHRLTGAALEHTLETAAGAEDVVAVVATAGTTNGGIVDDLEGVAAACERHRLWMHVDGAYGGAALFSPRARPRFAGIEHADSFVVDPHKWLFAPFDCAALLYREPRLAKAVHTQDASYLDVMHEDDAVWNPSDYAIHLTRRARGLPLWFSLAVNGTDAYRDAIDTVLDTVERSADLVRATPHVELVRQPELSILLLRRPGWQRADYDRWSERLLTAQTAFVTPTTWEGEPAARLAFLHPDTSLEMVEEILRSMA
jgi:glutamate/tyrosine decarboxylase-like PLP-dependent enzyme